jgi:hypothetical protein
MAENPAGQIIELINNGLRPYDPETGKELWILLQDFPEILAGLSSTFMALELRLEGKPGEMQSLSEALSTMERLVEQAKEAAEQARDDFKRANDFWLGGDA